MAKYITGKEVQVGDQVVVNTYPLRRWDDEVRPLAGFSIEAPATIQTIIVDMRGWYAKALAQIPVWGGEAGETQNVLLDVRVYNCRPA